MNRKSRVMLIGAVFLSVGGAMIAAPAGWESLITPQTVGGILVSLSGALMGVYGVKIP